MKTSFMYKIIHLGIIRRLNYLKPKQLITTENKSLSNWFIKINF
jgi:hypothetical protein